METVPDGHGGSDQTLLALANRRRTSPTDLLGLGLELSGRRRAEATADPWRFAQFPWRGCRIRVGQEQLAGRSDTQREGPSDLGEVPQFVVAVHCRDADPIVALPDVQVDALAKPIAQPFHPGLATRQGRSSGPPLRPNGRDADRPHTSHSNVSGSSRASSTRSAADEPTIAAGGAVRRSPSRCFVDRRWSPGRVSGSFCENYNGCLPLPDSVRVDSNVSRDGLRLLLYGIADRRPQSLDPQQQSMIAIEEPRSRSRGGEPNRPVPRRRSLAREGSSEPSGAVR